VKASVLLQMMQLSKAALALHARERLVSRVASHVC